MSLKTKEKIKKTDQIKFSSDFKHINAYNKEIAKLKEIDFDVILDSLNELNKAKIKIKSPLNYFYTKASKITLYVKALREIEVIHEASCKVCNEKHPISKLTTLKDNTLICKNCIEEIKNKNKK